MENGVLLAGPAARGRSGGLRLTSLFAALALVLAMFVLVQEPADASPATGSVAAAVALVGVGDDAAQINFRQIVCPILLAIRNAFAASPFFNFIAAILSSLLVGFGCAPS